MTGATGPAIYRCARGCTIAIPREDGNPAEITLVDPDANAFPECRGCTEMDGRQSVLWFGDGDEPRLSRGACELLRIPASHRDLVPHPHVCTCGHAAPEEIPEAMADPCATCENATCEECEGDAPQEPEPVADAATPDDEPPLKFPWTEDEDGTIRVCASHDEAVSRYACAYGFRRKADAVKQRWYKHNREGTLIRPGLRCTIRDNGPFSGARGTVAGFTDGKSAVNVAADDGSIYQVSAWYVEVEA